MLACNGSTSFCKLGVLELHVLLALVSQVVSPQDIGVNYDMIGGLNDVKELLRQSITYPLKYPHLLLLHLHSHGVGILYFG